MLISKYIYHIYIPTCRIDLDDENSKPDVDDDDGDGTATKDSDSKPGTEPKDGDFDRPSSSGKSKCVFVL